MRILVFILLSSLLVMCKSKDAVPSVEPLSFVVILTKNASPKTLKKESSFKLIDFKKVNKTLNQWTLKFDEDIKQSKKIKAELLNHPDVISVFEQEEFDRINLKNGQKSKVGAIGKRKATKQ